MSTSDYTVASWNALLASHPTAQQTTEYVWASARNNDLALAGEVLNYAKHNGCAIDITHAVHLSCVYAQHEMLKILDQYTTFTPHHIMTGLYSAASGCQNTVLEYLLNKADVWGDEFYQDVDGDQLMNVVCTPGNVTEHRVLECIKILEPLTSECCYLPVEILYLLDKGYTVAAQYLLPYTDELGLQQVLEAYYNSNSNIADKLESLLLNHKLTLATQSVTPQPGARKKM